MQDKTETRLLSMRSGKIETETRLGCKTISRLRPRLLIDFQSTRDRDYPWLRISQETKRLYTSVSRQRRDRDSRQSVCCNSGYSHKYTVATANSSQDSSFYISKKTQGGF